MLQQIDLIRIREKFLNRILGISPNETFNTNGDSGPSIEGLFIVTSLKQAVNSIQAQVISSGGENVNYATLANSEIYKEFQNDLLPQLRHFNPVTLESNALKLAFWINLYNVLVIDSVIRLNIQTSITEKFGGILRFFRQAAYDIQGYRTSLEDIEHGILRCNRGNPYIPGNQFGSSDPRNAWVITPMDSRIHFAINCASKSCPPIGIYSPDKIDIQLSMATRNFIAQETWFDPKTNTLEISQIFNWFAVDFGGKDGVLKFIQRNLPNDNIISNKSKHNQLNIKFKPYDWGLNLQMNQ
jgi:hypothetical protein